ASAGRWPPVRSSLQNCATWMAPVRDNHRFWSASSGGILLATCRLKQRGPHIRHIGNLHADTGQKGHRTGSCRLHPPPPVAGGVRRNGDTLVFALGAGTGAGRTG